MDNDSITRIFCDADDFCTRLERYCKARLLPPSGTGGRWFPRSRLTPSEVMTIVILFHLGGYFPRPVSYNRFVELMGCGALPPALYTRIFRREKPAGTGFIRKVWFNTAPKLRFALAARRLIINR
ncbi:MAG: hypothetical protein LBO04_02125 [Spirochaetaceae bacterium]|jgi:hypothetical protein|nr:hypothetical protein [Spirochaetaceae bacterium]